MAFKNQHVARVKPTEGYVCLTRERDKFGKGIDAVSSGEELVDIRFDSKLWKVSAAKKWLKDKEYGGTLFEKAIKNPKNSFVLAHTSPTLVLSEHPGDVPSFIIKKEIMHVGLFYKASDDIRFEITTDVMDHWVNTFYAMSASGLKVTVPPSHWESDKNHGFVRDMFVEDEGLFVTMELFGEEAAELVKTHDVSVYSPVEWIDGNENLWIRPILHVAFTPIPAIPGLKGFQDLAASLLSRQETNMFDFSEIKKALGIETEMTEESAGALILSAFESIGKGRKEAQEQLTTIKSEKLQVDTDLKTLKLSKGGKTPDPLLVRLAADSQKIKMGALVASGIITPSVKDQLLAIFHGEDNKNLVLSLATGNSGMFDQLVDVLSKNTPVKLKEQTGPQGNLELNDPSKGPVNPMAKEIQRRTNAVK